MSNEILYDEARKQFRRETTDHELTILQDDGLYRHLRVAKPGTRMWHWDVITWPGYLTIVGDIGDGYTFTRELDMFTWFNLRGVEPYDINPQYWRQKLVNTTREHTMSFSGSKFLQWMRETVTEHFEYSSTEMPAAVATALAELDEPDYWEQANELATEFGDDHNLRDLFEDMWDVSFQDYDHHFLLACFAIVDSIRRYRAAEPSPAVTSTDVNTKATAVIAHVVGEHVDAIAALNGVVEATGGPDHIVRSYDDGTFTLQHPVTERLAGTLFDCAVHRELTITGGPTNPGTYRITRADGDFPGWTFTRIDDPKATR
ncbi:DUF6085 family protein [Agromyces sp. NPDC058136]|uniref:DUF6085 family protein n=1 Tax=Agromyces sp. NPDC058136 TaxID=3346354 RepID=UPI0036D9CCB8